jgi:hypothetical protein
MLTYFEVCMICLATRCRNLDTARLTLSRLVPGFIRRGTSHITWCAFVFPGSVHCHPIHLKTKYQDFHIKDSKMDQSRTHHLLSHPTLQIDLIGTLVHHGLVSGYRGIPYGKVEKRWTRATAYSHHSDSVFDARNFGYVKAVVSC